MSDTLEQLREQAAELGIEFDGRWGEARIQEEIDKALGDEPEVSQEPKEEPDTPEPEVNDSADAVENISKTAQMVCGKRLAVGKKYTITDRDRENDRFMKKVARAIKLGLLKKA